MWKRATTAIVVALGALVAATASAQTTSPAGATGQQSTGTSPQTTQTTVLATPAATRPATTTTMGDTGLWFVPTGEVLPAGRWSFSLYRVNFDYVEGFTDVSNWPITFGVGIKNRAELFAAIQAVRRIDRDARPIFFNAQGRRARRTSTRS